MVLISALFAVYKVPYQNDVVRDISKPIECLPVVYSYDVNQRAAFKASVMGEIRAGIDHFCTVMVMQAPSKAKSRQLHLKCITEAAQQAADDSTMRPAKVIGNIPLQEVGGIILEVVDAAVSFDGTWVKCGHSSLLRVQEAISIDTGKVLDTKVHSKMCQEYKIEGRRNARLQ